MNKFLVFFAAVVLVLFGACQKQQTEAERNAEVEREVRARLAAEHQATEQQQLAQRQAELDAREKALSEKERATATPPERPRAVESSASERFEGSPGASSYSIFYTKLEPLGVWRETPTYGYVWQPRQAMESRSWRPYTNGHWVYTDAGWTWISEESFGWATYHYGRWTSLRGIGWVWVPGEEWAPAWVSWRTSNDYVGWAPLPPEAQFERRTGIQNWSDNYYDIGPEQYCFVPTREIGTERIERVVVPPEQNVTIVNQTTNVTNISYNNTIIVNHGPNYDELRTRTQRPIQRLRLERRTTVEAEIPRPVFRGEVVEMAAPVIASARVVERPPTVKERVTETVVEHGWERITDQPAAQRARAKMKSEATPPPNAPSKTFVKPAPIAGQPRTGSPAPRPMASPAVRSTTTPAPTPAAPAARATTTSPRLTRPAHTPPITGTPALPASQAGLPQPTPSPELTATPRPRATATPSPISTPIATPPPTFSPRALPQQFSPTPSLTPSFSTPPRFGRAGKKEERRAQKELRKQERAERKGERFEAQTPTPAATATSAALTSPSLTPTERPGKEHKKKKRPGDAGASPTPTATVSP
jgi:hypothetical protein